MPNVKSLPMAWNRPVDPVSDGDFHARKTKPVTAADLHDELYLTGGVVRDFAITDGLTDIGKLKDDFDHRHASSWPAGESSPDGKCHNFGKIVPCYFGFLNTSNWREAIDEIKKRNLYLCDVYGFIPGLRESRESGGVSSFAVSGEVQKYIQETLGESFLGWDNGEHDGRWFWQSLRNYPSLVTRQQAYKYFQAWFLPFLADIQNTATALCGLTFPHYFAKMDGHRMIGAEFLEGLISVPMWAAWVRGASRQYQMFWMAIISFFSRFGHKSYVQEGFLPIISADCMGSDVGNPAYQGGSDHGQPISIMRRVWYLAFMYGVNIEALQGAQYMEDNVLSPLGKMQLQATKICARNEKRRGVQYCPVAALIDFHAGWTPPRHYYSDSFYTVWGGIPYEAGDHQVDLFFREIFPGYENASYYQDLRGYLTPTPYGDIVDVLLSDVDESILERYAVVWVLGEIRVGDELLHKLLEYAEKGGRIIWALSQLDEEAISSIGITKIGPVKTSRETIDVQTNQQYREVPYSIPHVEVGDGEVLLKDGQDRPVLISRKLGKGEISTIIPPFGMSKERALPHPVHGADPALDTNTICYCDKPMDSPCQLLEGLKKLIFSYLDSFNLVEIKASRDPIIDEAAIGRPAFVQYVTNVRETPDKIMLTVVNNEQFPVYVKIKAKNANIVSAVDLVHDDAPMVVRNGQLPLTVYPGESADRNIFIIELILDHPVVQFMEKQ